MNPRSESERERDKMLDCLRKVQHYVSWNWPTGRHVGPPLDMHCTRVEAARSLLILQSAVSAAHEHHYQEHRQNMMYYGIKGTPGFLHSTCLDEYCAKQARYDAQGRPLIWPTAESVAHTPPSGDCILCNSPLNGPAVSANERAALALASKPADLRKRLHDARGVLNFDISVTSATRKFRLPRQTACRRRRLRSAMANANVPQAAGKPPQSANQSRHCYSGKTRQRYVTCGGVVLFVKRQGKGDV